MGVFSDIAIDIESMIASGYDDAFIVKYISKHYNYTVSAEDLAVTRQDVLENQGIQ